MATLEAPAADYYKQDEVEISRAAIYTLTL